MPVENAGLDRGLAFLLEQQSADGGWHSRTYGALRGGAATTALVLDALSHGGVEFRRLARPAAERAVEFLMSGVKRRGCAACPDGSLDYPVYATALLLTADARWPTLLSPMTRDSLRQYLVDAQVTRARGFAENSPHIGGWDVGSVPPPRAVTTGTNISITAFALEALAAAVDRTADRTSDDASRKRAENVAEIAGRPNATSQSPSDAVRKAALEWLERCQSLSADGGFCYSPDPASADNKAPVAADASRPASYGTATCDGIRAMVACGVRRDDERLSRAIEWLRNQPTDRGIPGLAQSDWSQAMSFYYLSSLARVLPALHNPDLSRRYREHIRRELAAEQRSDGCWSNPVERMREDDPLIATSLAVVGWSRCG